MRLSPGTLEALSKVAGGDMRRAITTLQSAARLGGKDGVVDASVIHDVAGVVPGSVADRLVEACRSGSFSTMQAAVENAIREGYPVRCLFVQGHAAQSGNSLIGLVTCASPVALS